MNCKTFFNRNGGFYLNGTRCTLVACEAQDNWSYGLRIARNYATMKGCIADSNQNYSFLLTAGNGYLGGLNLTGITALGRNEQQAGKHWTGQQYGGYLFRTTFNDCRFTGVSRDNSVANYSVVSSEPRNCVEQILDGRLAEF
ncbi:MAG: hypothetical protein AB8B63_24790 [Granulosicoccus sp.]